MNVTTTNTEEKSERVSNGKVLEQQWDHINLEMAQNHVNRLQFRIAKATQVGKKSTVKRLQYLLTHSFYAKVMAVKKVTTNKGKKNSWNRWGNLVNENNENESRPTIELRQLSCKTR